MKDDNLEEPNQVSHSKEEQDAYLRDRAEKARQLLKETFPEEIEQLDFLFDEEWFENNYHMPFFNIKLSVHHYNICKECHKPTEEFPDGGTYWNTPKCPMLQEVLNIKASQLARAIIFSKVYCKYRLQAESLEKLNRSLEECGLSPNHLQRFTLENFRTFDNATKVAKRQAVEYIESYTAKKDNLYIFAGVPNTGKTHLAVAIAYNIANKYNIPFKYVNVPDLLRDYRHIYTSSNTSREYDVHETIDMLERFSGPIILDDFGREKVTDYTLDVISSIISKRYDERYPVIVTSYYDILSINSVIPVSEINRSINGKYTGVTGSSIIHKILARCSKIDMNRCKPYIEEQ